MPSPTPQRHVVVATFPGGQVLDITGPLEVFSTANHQLAERSPELPAPYSLEVVSTTPGPVQTSSGLEIGTRAADDPARPPVDTLIVAGGRGTEAALQDGALTQWITREAPRARRVASVCSGAFLLARAGLLDGRRATTHWRSCSELARLFPRIRVEPDPIFVRDGNVYTSAGVCAGMDLALALVEEDLGRDLALAVAQHLVVFLKRAGGQSQFSAPLQSQLAEQRPLRELQGWIVENPGEKLSVEVLAARSGMSPRNFARVFQREVGATPARWVEQVRVEAARRRLEESEEPIEAVADSCGFGTAETLRRSFLRNLGVAPREYRQRFRGPGPRTSRPPGTEPDTRRGDER